MTTTTPRPVRPTNPATGRPYTKAEACKAAVGNVFATGRAEDGNLRVQAYDLAGRSYTERPVGTRALARQMVAEGRVLRATYLYTGDVEWASACADEYSHQTCILGNEYSWKDEVKKPREGWYDHD